MASVISAASGGLASSSQRRGVTPLVLLLKRSGNISAKSFSDRVLQQLGVNGGDAVGAVRADDGQVRHAHLPHRRLLDQAHALRRGLVAGIARLHVVEEAAVDLVDDLQMARQQQLEQPTGHFSSASGSSVWLVYASVRTVRSQASSQPRPASSSEDAHQFGDGQRRVRVVELDGDLVGQRVPVGVAAAEAAR